MIVGVAVCPGAPLLVPGLAPGLALLARDLVDSCTAAVVTLRGAGRILLLTSGPRVRDLGADTPRLPLRHPPGTAVTSSLLTDSRLAPCFSSRLAGPGPSAPGAVPPGVGVVVGTALLDVAGVAAPATAVELRNWTDGDAAEQDGAGDVAEQDEDAAPDMAYLRALVGGPDERVGVLAIGEGTASRGPDSPGGGHDGAEAFDSTLAAALASGDPVALSAAVAAGRSQASAMLWTSGPSWGVLSALCADRPPTRAELHYDDAPFGVGYLVASWSWG